jgi:hypothetical protein
MRTKDWLPYFLICAGTVATFPFTFCSKKVRCPGFEDAELTAWFPYTDNQPIAFETITGERKAFLLKNHLTTAPYEFVQSLYGRGKSCFTEKVFKSNETDSSGRSKFYISLQKDDGIIFKSASILIDNTSISFFDLADTGFVSVSITNRNAFKEKLSTTTISNKTFTNVVSAKIDTTNLKSGIYQVYYSRQKGIVGFTEYPSLKQWALQ